MSGKILSKLYAVAVCIAAMLVHPAPSSAHPHAWIDMRTAVIFDAQGRVSALRVMWTFDEFYTAFATDGLDKDGDGVPDDDLLRALADESMKGLAEVSYFTFMEAGGKPIAHAPVKDYESTYFQGRLGLVFTVPLAQPIDPRRQPFVYRVYDPSYYIEVLHVKKQPVLFEGTVPQGCHEKIDAPKPSIEALTTAQSLDRTQTAANGLGLLFAEMVTVRCS